LLDSVRVLLNPKVSTLLGRSFAEIAEAGESLRYRVFADITNLIKRGIAYEENLLAQRQEKLNKVTLALTYSLTAVATTVVLSFLFLTIYISYKRNLLQGFLGSVLDSTSNAIVNYKPVLENGEVVDFKYVYINKAALRDYNLTESEVLGSTVNQRMRGNGTDMLPYFKQVYKTGVPASFEVVLTRGGTVRYIWANIVREGNSLTGCFNEITAQKKAEMNLAAANKALQETNKKLQSTNEELSRFIHVSSHDLKEPVRKAVLFTDRLLQEDATLSQSARYLAGKVQASHWVMNEMIEGVQRYSAISKAAPEMKPVPLRDVVQQVEKELAAMIQEKQANISFGDLPVIKGDENMIRQLMHQLLHNALKFSRDRQPQSISIRADIVPAPENKSSFPSNGKGFCRIVVQDEGIGLIGENRNDIFSPFVRQRPKDKYDGAGLGLALCKKIVEQHGGTIQAESNEGSGAVFTFTLPKA
jgi:signal transduction histidine kinase